jgi:hypothetical protein
MILRCTPTVLRSYSVAQHQEIRHPKSVHHLISDHLFTFNFLISRWPDLLLTPSLSFSYKRKNRIAAMYCERPKIRQAKLAQDAADERERNET